ncbi:hypothetical protein BDV39DRAFT_211999 [Aspergillus sergii]|uniref:Monooxygenase n=1 Tax=Aspergillus sergii TaxID=1034303 RepID=A0A5N6XL09_9EURO|nr:hypothetical protein BDV39DRAFT_211999 [Aspergillus sergii]
MENLEIIIIGAGPSGIALAHTLKRKLGFYDFTIYDKLDGPGGTWRQNKYPGVGCDVPTILYSFSFNQNPNWSKELCEGPEILDCTVDKFDLRKHMYFGVECLSASWDNRGFWEVRLLDTVTNIEYVRTATMFVSAVGGISKPRDTRFPGIEKFTGEVFHTARWNSQFDYSGKRLAVVGNGCSAAQVVPAIAKNAGFVKQYARSAQWYHERPNRSFTAFEKWCFRNIPLWERYLRLRLFLANDSLVATYVSGVVAEKLRANAEKGARQYIYQTAPKKYHKFLVPDFPLGCKRRIFDPNYLESLHRSNIELAPVGIDHVDEGGIVSTDGVRTEFDAIILATGFDVQQFITPMEIYGKGGRSLAQFGPNTFPAHNSVLFASEVEVEYLARTLIAPIIDGQILTREVKATAENQWVNSLQTELKGSVFEAGCSNWYINRHGRNSASWPGYASSYWKETWKSQVGVFKDIPRSHFWFLNTLWRWARTTSKYTYGLLFIPLAALLWRSEGGSSLQLSQLHRNAMVLAFCANSRE